MNNKINKNEALIIAKNKDYLLGYIDCLIDYKKSNNIEYLAIKDNVIAEEPKNEILGNNFYIDITCTCGNYIAFKTQEDVPEKSFKCTLCEQKYMIYYLDEFKCT